MQKSDPFHPDNMKAQFHELTQQINAIEAESAPLRKARDDYANNAMKEEKKMNARIKEIEKDLYDMKVKKAILARALGNFVGGVKAEPAAIGANPAE